MGVFDCTNGMYMRARVRGYIFTARSSLPVCFATSIQALGLMVKFRRTFTVIFIAICGASLSTLAVAQPVVLSQGRLTERALQSRAWLAFVDAVSSSHTSAMPISSLEAACRKAQEGLDLIASASDDVECIDAAAKLIHPGNEYVSVKELKRRDASRTPRPLLQVSKANERVVVMRIPSFVDATYRALVDGLNNIDLPDWPAGIVLDLRANEGGLLDAVGNVAALFVADGSVIAQSVGVERSDVLAARPKRERPVHHSLQALLDTARISVLVGPRTSGGAEMLASALRIHRRATIVGTRSAGMAESAVIRALPTQDHALRLVVGRFTNRDGTSWSGSGVVPDLELTDVQMKLAASTSLQADVALEIATQHAGRR